MAMNNVYNIHAILFLAILYLASANSNSGGISFLKTSSQTLPPYPNVTAFISSNKMFHVSDPIYERKLKTAKTKAVGCLLSRQNRTSEADDDIVRTIHALYLADPLIFQNSKSEEFTLLSKRLVLRASVELSRDSFRLMTLSTLSNYIIALLATCNDPTNFHGYNLATELRDRTNLARSSKVVNPFAYLTLCIAGTSTPEDFYDVEKNINRAWPRQVGVWSLSMLALSCIENTFKQTSRQNRQLTQFLSEAKSVNLGNIYDAALLTQAMSTLGYRDWNLEKVLDFILEQQQPDGCFENVFATYSVMPILSGWTLQYAKNACHKFKKGEISTKFPKSERNFISMQYSLEFDNGERLSLQMKVSPNATLFDLMRIASTENNAFTFQYEEMPSGEISVFSFGSLANDAEKGAFWAPYIVIERGVGEKTPIKLTYSRRPTPGEYFLYWYKKN